MSQAAVECTLDMKPNPVESLLRMDRIPHVWCPGCGIGTTVNCFARAIIESKIEKDDLAVVSGIGCTGRVAGYLNVDSFHTTHGRAIPFATGLKLSSPKTNVVVYSGDGDLISIGGNHFMHAARRNMDITVICVNNFTYGMTGGQVAPTTPETALASTTPFGSFVQPFNLPFLAESCGAVYVARWTMFHVVQLVKAMKEAIAKPGFSFVEVIAPCPTLYVRRNKRGDSVNEMQYYKARSKRAKPGTQTRDVAIGLDTDIMVGKFVDGDRPSYINQMNQQLAKELGDKYVAI
jgi:2-oxoglutarate/2-oxoacid ferredoxin oxidoreductase subunit beta